MDYRLFHLVNQLDVHTGWARPEFALYARAGIIVFPMLMVWAWVVHWRRCRTLWPSAGVIWIGAAPLVAYGVDQVISHSVKRPRPFVTHADAFVAVGRSRDFSFPSDHVAVAAAIAGALLFVNRRIGLIALVLTLLMAFSRVYVGVHYPGDVVAGLAIGLAVGFGGARPFSLLLTRTFLRPWQTDLVATEDG